MKTITSRQNPIVATFRAAARARGDRRQHLLLDGARLVDDARSAGVSIDVAMLSAAALREGDGGLTRLAEALRRAGVRTLAATGPVLDAVSPVRATSGAVALATHQPPSCDQVVGKIGHGLIVCPLGVQDPGNVGAIIRAADAGGARGVVVTGGSADPYGWRALRGAMGSTFRIPVALSGDAVSLIESVRTQAAKVVAAVPRGGTPLYDVTLTGPTLLLVGAEGRGLCGRTGADADVQLSIPMSRGVDSLNVAIATALIIYEARRQQQLRRTRK